LALIGGAVAEIGQRDVVVAAIFVGEGEPGAKRDLRADDAVAAVESLLDREHVHGAALAPGIAVLAAGELGHHALGIHAAGQHVAVIAVAGDHFVARLERHLHADNHRFLADIEMAETANQSHPVHLPRLFLESADQQHQPVGGQLLVLTELGRGLAVAFRRASGGGTWLFLADDGHATPRKRRWNSAIGRPLSRNLPPAKALGESVGVFEDRPCDNR
jgi:hypothetical protein